MDEYLVFIKRFGRKSDGKTAYQFYFSTTPEVVWGDFWNICPCAIVPDLKPDANSVSSVYECDFEEEINLASNNSCFSMQDCIDQIIALGFFNVDSNNKGTDGKVLKFSFGDKLEDVLSKFESLRYFFYKTDFKPIDDDDDEMIDNLIDKLGDNE